MAQAGSELSSVGMRFLDAPSMIIQDQNVLAFHLGLYVPVRDLA